MLSPQELKEEALVQLRQLAQSPGWGLYLARLARLSKAKEVAKADALRSGEGHEAVMLQGVIDGVELALRELERYMDTLSQGHNHLPTREAV